MTVSKDFELEQYYNKGMAGASSSLTASEMRSALEMLRRRWGSGESVGKYERISPAGVRAKKIYEGAYKPWQAAYKKGSHGKKAVGAHQWIKNYWDWLAGGAKTRTERPAKGMAAGHMGTQYLTDQGWQTYGQLDPESERAKYIAAKIEAAEADTGEAQKYWEGWTTPGGWDYTAHNAWTGIEGNPLWADYKGMGWLPSTGPSRYKPPPPTPSPVIHPEGASPISRNVTINFGAGGNREGNAATAGAAGTVSRTPGATFYSGDGFMKQARERAAKRTGRRLSQAGVTAVPSLTRLGKYRDSFLRGGF